GRVRTLAGGPGPGFANGPGAAARFDTPTALAPGGDGRLWIADTGNRALRWIDADGSTHTWRASAWGATEPVRPLALAATHDGALYVSELSPGRVLQLSRDGRSRVLAGGGAGPWFARPSALWLEADGSLLLADAAGHRLHRIAPRGADAPGNGPIGPSPAR